MHRAFITANDYESYEAPVRAAMRRQNDREAELSTHAAHAEQQPTRVGDAETRAINARFGIPDTYAKTIPERFRKGPVLTIDFAELSKGPKLPNRSDKGLSIRSRTAVRKTGYYHAATDAFSSDAYMGKPSPIDRKGRSKTFRNGRGESYVLPHGLHSSYRETTDEDTGITQPPHQAGRWGKPLTSKNKHLAYWRDPTAREALRNLTETVNETYLSVEIERGLLIMWARLHSILVKRKKIVDAGRSEIIRAVTDATNPGDMVTVDMYSRDDITRITDLAPKRYKEGEFGEFLKFMAKRAATRN